MIVRAGGRSARRHRRDRLLPAGLLLMFAMISLGSWMWGGGVVVGAEAGARVHVREVVAFDTVVVGSQAAGAETTTVRLAGLACAEQHRADAKAVLERAALARRFRLEPGCSLNEVYLIDDDGVPIQAELLLSGLVEADRSGGHPLSRWFRRLENEARRRRADNF